MSEIKHTKKYKFHFSGEALASKPSDEEFEILKYLRKNKGVISNVAVANDTITELALELETLFRAQRYIKSDPLNQRNIILYNEAIKAAGIALVAIKTKV